MNKRTAYLTILILLVAATAATAYFLTAKTPYFEPIKTMTPATTEPAKTPPVVDCKELNLPQGSFTIKDGVCEFTDEYYRKVVSLAQKEYDSGDGHQLTFIKNVYQKAGSIYIDADYFQWLSDSEGTCTSTSALVTPKRPACNPNGFLIVNDNQQIRTLKLSPQVKIRLLEDYNTIPDLRALSPQEFLTNKNKFGQKFYVYTGDTHEEPYYVPFVLILKNGAIVFIHQVYTP
jgi:hypothetical protein